MSFNKKNKVIIAPLNWGWGHVTRCIPIIRELQSINLIPVIACDGDALLFFKKEFPTIETISLTGYKIKYTSNFKLSMLLNIPNIVKAIVKENREINHYILKNRLQVLGLISDNRLGIYSNKVQSIYITHQLNIKAGLASGILNLFHHYFIKKHQECWVPDEPNSVFTGELSQSLNIKKKYIGLLSSLNKTEITNKYKLLVLLSGIEGQRRDLETLLLKELSNYKGKVLFVRGSLKNNSIVAKNTNITVVNYLGSKELEKAILASELIICRSGYSTIMDLVKLNKSAFLIPTPGQTEQEYLAKYLKVKGVFNTCTQKEFNVEMLKHKKDVEGFNYKTSQHLLSKELKKFFKPSLV